MASNSKSNRDVIVTPFAFIADQSKISAAKWRPPSKQRKAKQCEKCISIAGFTSGIIKVIIVDLRSDCDDDDDPNLFPAPKKSGAKVVETKVDINYHKPFGERCE